MPAGLLDSLLPDERLDLIKFLAQLGKPGDYDAAKRDVARFWRLYQATWKNSHLGIDRVAKGDFTLPDWVPTNSLVNGTLPSEVLATVYLKHEQARGLFAATRFQALKKVRQPSPSSARLKVFGLMVRRLSSALNSPSKRT